jgi:predicted dehydrogenase
MRLGIVGCGGVAQVCHLPAARRTPDVRVVALIDRNLAQARLLGRRFGIDYCADDYRQLAGRVDGVIVAVPNHLHGAVAADLLRMRMPVLLEKPLAPTFEEAAAIVDAASAAGVLLQAGHMYRFSQSAQLVKQVIDEGWLRPLRGFTLEYGSTGEWPAASGFFLRRAEAGGGVLMDIGPHMLDLLIWWLGDAEDVEYRDDSIDGVEAECHLSLALRGPTGAVRGDVTLSRLRRLEIGARIVGERFVLEWRNIDLRFEVRIRPATWPAAAPSFTSDFDQGDTFARMFTEQLRAFAAAIREGRESAVPGRSVLGSIALIQRCYRERKPLDHPWQRHAVRV